MNIQIGGVRLSFQDLLTAASLLIGLAGFLVAYLALGWSRKESRLKSLSDVLMPLSRAMQRLNTANNCRRANEQIQRSFPDASKAPEAVERVKAGIAKFHESIAEAEKECKLTESALVSCRFRFPDKLAAHLNRALEELFETARCVHTRSVDQADVSMAKLKGTYREITDYARGWRLSDPFEGMRARLKARRGGEEKEPPRFKLTKKEMDRVMALVGKRASDQASNTFAVHPPKKLIEHPEIAEAADVIEQLEDSIFEVVFQDGTYAMLSLTELMVFIYQLILLQHQFAELNEMFKGAKMPNDMKIDVNMSFSIADIMNPEVVKLLLSKLAFSDSPSDETDAPARDVG